MQYKTLSVLLFVTMAMAAPTPTTIVISETATETWIETLTETPTETPLFYAPVPGLPQMTPFPTEYVEELVQALPKSVQLEILAHPSAIPSIEREYLTKTQWLDQVPTSVQQWFSSRMARATGTPLSRYPSSSSAKATRTSTPLITSTATSTTTSHGSSSGSGAGSGSSSNSTSTSTSTSSHVPSTNGVSGATTNVAMNFAGAAALLGVALVL